MVAQHVKQRISPQLDARTLQRLAQHVVQLACAHPGLAHTLVAHQLHHGLCLLGALCLAPAPLVVRLAAQPHVLASPLHAQSLDERLIEDLPKGFFTTRTP